VLHFRDIFITPWVKVLWYTEPRTLGPQKGPGFQTQWCAGETPAGPLLCPCA